MSDIKFPPGKILHRETSFLDLRDDEDDELGDSETTVHGRRFLSQEGDELCPALSNIAHRELEKPRSEDADSAATLRITKPRDPNGQTRPRGRGNSRGINHHG